MIIMTEKSRCLNVTWTQYLLGNRHNHPTMTHNDVTSHTSGKEPIGGKPYKTKGRSQVMSSNSNLPLIKI